MDIPSKELDEAYNDGLITGGCGDKPEPPSKKYHRWAYTQGYLAGITIWNKKNGGS